MFLEYLSLAILLAGLTLVFFGFIALHEIPHKIAKKNGHPHAEAIGVAGWLSLFTLHAIWPIVFIWAVMYNKPPRPIFPQLTGGVPEGAQARKLAELEARLQKLENTK